MIDGISWQRMTDDEVSAVQQLGLPVRQLGPCRGGGVELKAVVRRHRVARAPGDPPCRELSRHNVRSRFRDDWVAVDGACMVSERRARVTERDMTYRENFGDGPGGWFGWISNAAGQRRLAVEAGSP